MAGFRQPLGQKTRRWYLWVFEDNTVSELLDGHGDLGQSESTPALNDGVYDRWCLCKSPSHNSSSYHDHRRRPAPLLHGHLSLLRLTLTPSSDTLDDLVRVLYSRHEIQSLHVPESYQSYSIISPSNSCTEKSHYAA